MVSKFERGGNNIYRGTKKMVLTSGKSKQARGKRTEGAKQFFKGAKQVGTSKTGKAIVKPVARFAGFK